MSEGRYRVLDFTTGTVRWEDPGRVYMRIKENCQRQGHIFATAGRPTTESRCLCGRTKWQPEGSEGASPP